MTIERPSTPGEAIRARCLECCCDQIAQIRNCTARTPEVILSKKCDPKGCFLWPYRDRVTGVDRSRVSKPPSRCRSIKLECQNCMGYGRDRLRLVKECKSDNCPLWSYREGHNPSRKGVGNRLNSVENLAKARSALGSTPDTPKTEFGPAVPISAVTGDFA